MMVEDNKKPPKIYRNVKVVMISWEIDGELEPVSCARDRPMCMGNDLKLQFRNLARVFRDIFHYTVLEVKLTIAGEPELHALLQSKEIDDDDLQIVYYIGYVEYRLYPDWNGMIAVPISQKRLTQDSENEWSRRLDCRFPLTKGMHWLQDCTQFPHLVTDILLILDCSLVDLESTSFLDFGNGTLRFETMSAGHRNPLYMPGFLTSRLAELLENATTLENRIMRKEYITTQWINARFFTINHSLGQEVDFQLLGNRVEDEYMQGIVIEPMDLPSFRHGSYGVLSRYEQARLFDYESLIYDNGHTEVYKAQMRHNSQATNGFIPIMKGICAIKRFTPRNAMQLKNVACSFREEGEILRKLSTWRHLHIVDFIGSFEVRSESKFGHFNLILPYAEGGNLYEFLRLPRPPEWLYKRPGRIPFCEAIFVQIKGIVGALAFLHAKTSHASFVIHRDIKPANILIFNGTFKLADFGSSKMKASEETSKTEWAMGTPMYEPPEKTIEDSDTHGRARDVWALGCVLLEILVFLIYGFREPAAVDHFEEERINSTPRGVKAFARTMASVEVWMASLGKLVDDHHQRNKDRWVDGDWNEEQKLLRALLAAIRGMMEINRARRIEALRASECLHLMLLI